MWKILQMMNKARRTGQINSLDEAVEFLTNKGVQVTGILRQGLTNVFKTPLKKPPAVKTGKINYSAMEEKLGTKLRGNETFDELLDIEKGLADKMKLSMLEEIRIAYPNQHRLLKGDETAAQLKEMLKNLDEHATPFATGGAVGLPHILGV
jgi:hypothetical protein